VNKLSSVLGAAAVIAIAVVFILQFRPASNSARTDNGPTCAVEVHGTCAVDAGQFWAAYRLIAGNADPSKLKAMGMRRKVADGLLEQWLLNQDAKRLGISVSEDDLSAEVFKGRAHVSLPAQDIAQLGYNLQLQGRRGELAPDTVRDIPVKGPKSKHFEQKVYEKNVRAYTRLSPEDFRAYQKNEVVAARMRDLVRSRVRVSEEEAFDQYSRDKSTATLDYVRFDRRFYADLVVDMSQKAIDAWAEAHKDEVDKTWESRKAQILPECRSVREIVVKVDGITATDEEKAKAKAKIDRAKERVAKGEDFAEVARSLSEGASASRGGEVGCLLKGKAPKPLEDAVSGLAAGKVSDVITTENAFYLVKLEQIAKDADAEKLGRAQTAKELYLTQEAERLTMDAAKKVAAAVKGGKSLKDALDQHLAELAKAKPAAEEKKKDKKAEKAGDKKKKGDDKAAEEKKDEDARAPVTLENHPNRPTIETTLPFNISGEPIPGAHASSDLTKIAFGLEKPGDSTGEVVNFDMGYIAFTLKEKTPASKESWDKDREYYMGSMRAYKQNDALIAYVKKLQASLAADAKYTKDLVEEPKGRPEDSAPAPGPMDDGE
jgi:peptidyl-prolyl cis-trans isomerase D